MIALPKRNEAERCSDLTEPLSLISHAKKIVVLNKRLKGTLETVFD
jgi:hypothetical protein